MDKTIKINLGGTLFQIDEEAYKILKKYLQDIDSRLRNTPGGAETVEDIELRIAEIFQSQGGSAGVISKDNVEAMISIIGKPQDFDAGSEEKETKEPYYHTTSAKKLYRNPDDIIISGVCGGIGAYLSIEAVWVRLLFILFTCFFGIGFFVYIALWIALPSAHSDPQKREMYGRDDYHTAAQKLKSGYSLTSGDSGYTTSGQPGSHVGNAFNEVFRALGKVLFIIVRIFLILVGITFVLTGFIALVSFIMVFFFNYPGYFSTHSFGVNLFYLPDFLNYVVNPSIAPWILILSFIVILMPLLALIYWGVKMIFWFRARDGIVSLIGLIIWVVCVAALSLLLFNEGISYAETAKAVTEEVLEKTPSDLYIVANHKVADLHYDKEISFDEENYNVFFIDDNKGLFISSGLNINNSDDNTLKINVRKRSAGRSRIDATRKAEGLLYDYRVSADTLYLDEYFAIPAGTKWSFDDVKVNLYIPEGTAVHFDKITEEMFRHRYYHEHNYNWNSDSDDNWDSPSDDNEYTRSGNENHSWIMTEDGLRRTSDRTEKTK
jgi:phage shock protein PspC (stress-responsive transcriptional regulator)